MDRGLVKTKMLKERKCWTLAVFTLDTIAPTSGHAHICNTQSNTVSVAMHRVALQKRQKTQKDEEETSCNTWLWPSVYNTSMTNRVFFTTNHVVFNFRDTYDLAGFSTSASTIYYYVLVWTWGSVEYYSHTIPCLGTVVSDMVHAWPGMVASTLHPYHGPSTQELCPRPPFQTDSGPRMLVFTLFKWTGPLVWEHP